MEYAGEWGNKNLKTQGGLIQDERTILQDERTLETRILNITCSFNTEKELQEIFEHKKKKHKFNMY